MRAAANLLGFAVLLAAVLMVWRQSWPGRRRLFVAQSAALALLALVLGLLAGRGGLVLVAAAVAVLKAWLVPRVLARMAAGIPPRALAPGRSMGMQVLAAGSLVVLAHVIMVPVVGVGEAGAGLPTAAAMPLTLAAALVGLFLCVTARDALGQVLGFLVCENGIFGLALVATWGLPGLVEAGVLLDVLVIVLLMEAVVLQIRREHDSLDVERLRELRG